MTDLPQFDELAEKSLLSALLVGCGCGREALELSPPHEFYGSSHQLIATEIYGQLTRNGQQVSVVQVSGNLRDKGRLQQIGGSTYLSQLIDGSPVTDSEVLDCARIVHQKYQLRRVTAEAKALAAIAQTGAVEDIAAAVQATIARVGEILTPTQVITLEGPADIFAQLPAINWLCKDLQLAPGRPNLLAGPGYGGKSIIAQSIAFAVATGQPVFGKYSVRMGKVIHLNYDQGRRVPLSRYQRLMRAAMMSPHDFGDRLSIASHPGIYLDDPACESALRATV